MAGSPTPVGASLRIMNETQSIADTVAAVDHHSSALDDRLVNEDMVEGMTVFAQKRPPHWKNR